ncbi:hypothetical protein AAFM71_07520 [Chromobacterium violaceum]|uniref:hypothetical protein n=1 Tax=Chromobacterium violaceum TaxID=536 RepID=UPI00385DB953
MTIFYQTYGADHHITPRAEPPADECETMRLPAALCGCPACCEARRDPDGVESAGGEV